MEDIIAGKYIPPRRVVHIGKYRFYSIYKIYLHLLYTLLCPRHEGRPAPALLPRHPAAGAGQVSRTNESAASGHVTSTIISDWLAGRSWPRSPSSCPACPRAGPGLESASSPTSSWSPSTRTSLALSSSAPSVTNARPSVNYHKHLLSMLIKIFTLTCKNI